MIAPGVDSVREQLWLLAHDDDRGLSPLIDRRAIGIGLAGATLIDLMLSDSITIDDGYVYPHQQEPTRAARHAAGSRSPTRESPPGTANPLTASVLHMIRDLHAVRITDVLRDPGLRLYERTFAALIAAGIVIEHRRTLRSTRYRLDDPATSGWVRSQFTRRLYRPVTATAALDGLCALIWALNLHSRLVLPYSTAEADTLLHTIVDELPARAGPDAPAIAIANLAIAVRHAVGDLATSAF